MFYCFVDILKQILHLFNVMFCRDNALLVDLGNINSVEVRANFGSPCFEMAVLRLMLNLVCF